MSTVSGDLGRFASTRTARRRVALALLLEYPVCHFTVRCLLQTIFAPVTNKHNLNSFRFSPVENQHFLSTPVNLSEQWVSAN